jgi:hypothetical protein
MNVLPRQIRRKVRTLAAPFSTVSGRERHSGSPLSILWSGCDAHREYLTRRFFQPDSTTTTYIGRRPVFLARTLAARLGCAMSVCLNSTDDTETIDSLGDLVIPVWTECELSLDPAEPYAESKELQRELRKSARKGMQGRVSKDPADLERFYREAYLPTMASSHAGAALPTPIEKRLMQMEEGSAELAVLHIDDALVAGVVIDYREARPALKETGVWQASAEYRKAGAIAAVNAFTLDYLCGRGFGTVNFGLSHAFLDDGGLSYKRKYRPAISGTQPEHLVFQFIRLDPGVRSMLRFGHCLSWQQGELHRTFFRSNDRPTGDEQVKRVPRSSWDFGIDATTVFDISGDQLSRSEGLTSLQVA